MLLSALLAILAAYLLGSIPTAYIVSRRFKGVDIREVGDRYMGAKNVFREIGRTAGVITVVGDVSKGSGAALLARALAVPEPVVILVALAAVSGHIWPIYLQFRGGAGFATLLGVVFVLLPRESALLSVPFAALCLTLGRRVGMGPCAALLLAPMVLLSWWLHEPVELLVLPIIVGSLVAARVYHKEVAGILSQLRPDAIGAHPPPKD